MKSLNLSHKGFCIDKSMGTYEHTCPLASELHPNVIWIQTMESEPDYIWLRENVENTAKTNG